MAITEPRCIPRFVSLNRLCQLSGKNRVTLLLRLRDHELEPDAYLDIGSGRPSELFSIDRVEEVRRLPLRRSPALPNPML